MDELVTLLTALISLIALIAFFVLCSNIARIKSEMIKSNMLFRRAVKAWHKERGLDVPPEFDPLKE